MSTHPIDAPSSGPAFRILLMEPDASLSDQWTSVLNAAGYEVEPALTPKDAARLLTLKSWDMAIVDLPAVAPEGSGAVQLVSEMVQDFEISVAVMVGSEIDRLRRHWVKLDADKVESFLKPVSQDKVLPWLALQAAQRRSQSVDPNTKRDREENFCSFRPEYIPAGKPLDMDVFIRIHAGHFVRVGQKGEAFELSKSSKWAQKGGGEVFVLREAMAVRLQNAGVVVSTASVERFEHEKRTRVMRDTRESVMDHMFTSKMDKTVLHRALQVTESIFASSLDIRPLAKVAEVQWSKQSQAFRFGVNACFVMAMLRDRLGQAAEVDLIQDALAALYLNLAPREFWTQAAVLESEFLRRCTSGSNQRPVFSKEYTFLSAAQDFVDAAVGPMDHGRPGRPVPAAWDHFNNTHEQRHDARVVEALGSVFGLTEAKP